MVTTERRLHLLGAISFFIFFGAGAQQAYLIPYLSRVTDWGKLECSIIIGAVYLTMTVFRVGNLYLFRGWSDRRYTMVGALSYLLFCVVMGATFWTRSYALAVAGAVVWGMGAALMWTGTTMQVLSVGDAGGGKHGSGMGFLYSATHAGWLSGAVSLGLIYRSLPGDLLWVLYAVAAAFTLAGNVLTAFLPATGPAVREDPSPRRMLEIMLRRRAQIASLLQFLSALAYGLLLGMFGRFIEQTYGSDWVWVSVSLYPATRMVMSFVGGKLADKLGHSYVLVAGFLCGAAGLLVMVLGHYPWSAVLAGFTLGMLSSTVPVVAGAIIGAAADRKRRPLAYGIIFGWRDMGVFAAAVGSNALAGGLPSTNVFVVFACLFGGCAALSGVLERYKDERFHSGGATAEPAADTES
jgi:MFS family permease